VNDLVADGDLSQGAAKHLLQDLDQARSHLVKGQTGPTVNQLLHLIRSVEDLVHSGELDAAAGQQLIDAASWIIAQLGG
jgi:polyhydroxyalkanoate synthesis regulator phasin